MEKHFAQFGAVADCVVVKDFGSVMGSRMARAGHLAKLKLLKFDAAFYQAERRTYCTCMLYPPPFSGCST